MFSSPNWKQTTSALCVAACVAWASSAGALPNPTMSGPNASDPAGFLDVNGLATNPTPYCSSPNYFDFWTFGSEADGEVAGTTSTGPGGVTMTLTDRAGVGGGLRLTLPDHGVVFDSGDDGTVDLSQPIFYSQWVFVDIDLNSEGFAVTGCVGGDALCGGGTPVAGVAVMGQSSVFAGGAVSTNQATGFASYNIGPGGNLGPTTIDSRMQIDFLGAVDRVFIDKIGTGGAGFAVGGGCEPLGIAKEAGTPETNAFGAFVVPYTLRVVNNLPDQATLESVLSAAEAASFAGQFSGPAAVSEIPIENLQVIDDLAAVFGSGNFTVQGLASDALTVNPGFDGDADTNLLAGTDALAPGTVATITFEVVFAPPPGTVYPLTVVNQATAAGEAQGVPVEDLSDNGGDASPASNNGEGGTGDPTPVVFGGPPPAAIPTAGQWGLLALALGLLLAGFQVLRRP